MVVKYVLAWLLSLFVCHAYAQVFDIPHGSDHPTRTLLISSKNPKAVVLLFPGGGGMMHMKDDGSTKNHHTFIRSVDLWAQYDIDAVLVDTPYDLGDLRRGDLRGEQEHLNRVAETVSYYKHKTGLPIWIFGHSMGTSTATHFVNQLNDQSKQLAGIIIAGTVRSAALNDGVTQAVQAIHHIRDECLGSPPSASRDIVLGRPKEYVSRLELIDGGITEGNICDSFAYHGFNQTERELIKRAAQFILNH